MIMEKNTFPWIGQVTHLLRMFPPLGFHWVEEKFFNGVLII